MSRSLCSLVASAAVSAFLVPAAQAALPAPVPEAPAPAAVVQASPTITWKTLPAAARYEFQLSADKQFGSIASSIKTQNTAATLKGTLIDGTYYWRVRGVSTSAKAGRWSTVRTFVKRWSDAPTLVSPTTDFGAVWPTSPLVLDWTPVAHAVSYNVVVATDQSLAQPVLGSVADPQTTQGTVLAFPGTLSNGTYYWQITPVDSDGHRGKASPVGRFTWGWPSSLSLNVADLNPAREVFDPLLSWSTVPGAARYDVEVNTTADFVPGSVVATASVIGNAMSPTKPLPNNTYYWRARAVDPDGRAGAFFGGTATANGSFFKEFDSVAPDATVPGLTLNDGPDPVAIGSTLSNPILTWNPVPGAASYEVAVAPIGGAPGSICDWSAGGVFGGSSTKSAKTDNPYIDLAAVGTGPNPSIGSSQRQSHNLADQQRYCARIRAIDGAGNVSQFTYLGGANNVPTFQYAAPPAGVDGSCSGLPQPTYLLPVPGQTVPHTPKFHWSSVPGARSYYVIVARDQALTNIIDIAFTDRTYYVPRDTYEDETTGYYWAVYPSPTAAGACPSDAPGTYPRFDKLSVVPPQQGPDDGVLISGQPIFRWGSAEGAKDYRIQVATDAEFKDLVDNIVTASTAYAPSTTYPVDTQLYWRVRARDANDIELGWSATRSFRRTLTPPAPDAGNPVTGSAIPVLAWAPVAGAVSYGFHVDRVDGKTQDFTVATPRFTPTEFYGNGVWKWKVRANFPATGGSVSGPYSGSTDFVRRILPPANPRAVVTPKRVLFSWDADTSGKSYKLEVARDDSFTNLVETVTTPNTAYAPLLAGAYADGGRFFWRVAILDKGNNLGAFAQGNLRLPQRLKVKTSVGLARHRYTVPMKVTVTDAASRRVAGATVTVSGAGSKVLRRRTGKKGTVTLRLRPARKGTVTVSAAKKSYVSGSATIGVY